MLTCNEARNKGMNACIDKIGRDFVEKFRDSSCNAFADVEDHMFCFVGVSDCPPKEFSESEPIILDGDDSKAFPYRASCNVNYSDGKIEFLDCVVP